MPARALAKEQDDTTRWVWGDTLPADGTSVLAARPKVGKTTLALSLALAVAEGQPFLGRRTSAGRVLYVAFEEGRQDVRDFAKRHPSDNLFFHQGGIEPALPDKAASAISHILTDGHFAFCVIDTLIRLVRIKEMNDYVGVSRALAVFHDVARRTECHIMFVQQMRKFQPTAGEEEVGVLGSTALTAVVDTVLTMQRTGDTRTVTNLQR